MYIVHTRNLILLVVYGNLIVYLTITVYGQQYGTYVRTRVATRIPQILHKLNTYVATYTDRLCVKNLGVAFSKLA